MKNNILSLVLVFTIVSFKSTVAQFDNTPLFKIGSGMAYNKRINQLASNVRIDIPILNDVEISPQFNYYPTSDLANGFKEYYADLDVQLYFYQYETSTLYMDVYLLGGYSFEYWINGRTQLSDNSIISTGPQAYNGFNFGSGVKNYFNKHWSLFADLRYYTNFKELSLATGLQFTVNKPHIARRGPRNKKIRKANFSNCPTF